MPLGESFRSFLFESRSGAIKLLRGLKAANTLVALVLIVYTYGFVHANGGNGAIRLLAVSLLVFSGIFLLRWLYAPDAKDYLKSHWFEGLLVGLLTVLTTWNIFSADPPLKTLAVAAGLIQASSYPYFYEVFLTAFMLLVMVVDAVKAIRFLSVLRIKPATLFLSSFLGLILFGTAALQLPAMTKGPGSLDLLDAFFTSTSASCVTGLVVVDTGSVFTFKGHLVLLVLMQLGGLGIVSFATFFATLMRQSMSIQQQTVLQQHLSSQSFFDARSLLKRIGVITLLIETGGAVGIFLTWEESIRFGSLGQKMFCSVFHSVSAFCNAGFSLFEQSLYHYPVRSAFMLHAVVALLILLGGIGFSTINELFSPRALRERLAKPWKDWSIDTKIKVYTSALLVVFGGLLILGLEHHNSLESRTLLGKVVQAFFQSITTRTAGFNTIDMAQLTMPTIVLIMGLMLIGASPGSTGGGIKTTTAWLLVESALATIRGKKHVEIGQRTVSNEVVFKAFSVFAFAISYNLVAVFVLAIAEPSLELEPLLFEQISAFSTVGLSLGATGELGAGGKLVIICSMFIGRVGPLTLAFALSRPSRAKAYKYPEGFVTVA